MAKELGNVRRFRTTNALWERFGEAVGRSPDPEADMSKVLRGFVRWYVRDPGAKLPDRPESLSTEPTPKAATDLRRFRTTDELWDRFQTAVDRSPDPEADMSKVLRGFVRWYVGEPAARNPDRPSAA